MKQDKFCRLVVAGRGKRDAYREAYDAENMKDKSCSVAAAELMANPNIQARMAELEEDVAQAARLTPEWILRGLMEEAVGAKEASARVRAQELLGKYLKMFREQTDLTITDARYADLLKAAQDKGYDISEIEREAEQPASSVH